MLKERRTKQSSDKLKRRWFSDEYYDLIVWEDPQGEIAQFELCYDKYRNEHSFFWSKKEGLMHLKVDDGEITGGHKMSPIYMADGKFDCKSMADKFWAESTTIDPEIAKFIHQKILNA
jgi:hypothetical protein